MDVLVFVLFLAAVIVFVIEAWVTRSLTAVGLACFAGAFLAGSPVLHR